MPAEFPQSALPRRGLLKLGGILFQNLFTMAHHTHHGHHGHALKKRAKDTPVVLFGSILLGILVAALIIRALIVAKAF